MKRALAVLFIGLGIVGISTLAGRRGADERFTAAREAVDKDCRAFRSEPANRHAEVCHYDQFGPKALPLYNEAKALVDQARSAAVRGDVHGAEGDLARAIALTDDMARQGTDLARFTQLSIVESVLALAAEHRAIDATRLLREVHFDFMRHPLANAGLNHRWTLAHWNEHPTERSRSNAQLADAMEQDTAAFQQMEVALVEHRDAAECETIARKHDLGSGEVLCAKYIRAFEIASRLDATQHGRLSSASR